MVRRAQLRSVDGNSVVPASETSTIAREILCKPANIQEELKYSTSNNIRYGDCNPLPAVDKLKPKRPLRGSELPPGPINNFPRVDEYDGGMPDAVTLEIFALRRRNAELAAQLVGANNKLTRALELLYSLRRFLQLWVFHGQGETYDQVTARVKGIESIIAHIECRENYPSPPLELPERWQKQKER